MPTYLSPNSDIIIDDIGNFAFGSFDIEAWYTNFRAIQMSDTVAISWSKTTNEMNIVTNAYQFDASTWRYRSNGAASRLRITDTFYEFMHVASGLADADITWVSDLLVEIGSKVSIGSIVNNGRLALQMNSSAGAVQVGGLVYATTTTTGNITTGDDTLASAPIPSGSINTATQSLRFEAYGTTANNANAKTLRIYLGAELVAARTLTISVANNWFVQGTIYAVATSNQKAVVLFVDGTAHEVDIATPTQNSNTDLTLVVKGEGVASNDIVLQAFKVWWDNHDN